MCPKWFNVGILEDENAFKDLVQQTIDKTVKKAKLPILRIREDPQAVELVETIIGIVFDFVAGKIPSVMKCVHVIVKTVNPDAVGKLEMSIEDSRRKVINLFYKGTFGYHGLVVGSGSP